MLKDGFYTALGTPVDEDGRIIESSLKKHIYDQIEAGASGLLLLGSMGMEPYIRESEYGKIVKIAVDAVKGMCPLFVGAMDNSVWRVKEKLEAIGDVKIDGVVLTTPYYYTSTQKEIIEFFKAVADISRFPVYLYDLPIVTKTKITYDTVLTLMEDKRFAGIKSGDIVLARDLLNSAAAREDFSVLFSTVDIFDVAYAYGLKKNLDGMFSCTPKNSFAMYQRFSRGNIEEGIKHLNNIIELRDLFVEEGVFPSFTAAMNLLGYEGCFSPDYMGGISEEAKQRVAQKLKEIGEV